MTDTRPVIKLQPGRDKRIAQGHPWVYSNEIVMDKAAKDLPPGSLVRLEAVSGKALGVATFNAHTLVAARLMDRDPNRAIDRTFFVEKIRAALALRAKFYPEPFYRLIHAEADGVPGLVLDRFGDVVTAQLNTAGTDALEGEILAAISETLKAKAVVLRNDTSARKLEGLAEETRLAAGELTGPVEIRENGARFFADPLSGQKTGWFYDQRENRRFMAALSKGASVLDLYCFGGGFAVQAALAGATQVTAIDRSEAALALVTQAMEANGVAGRCTVTRGDAFSQLERIHGEGKKFGMVIADPPAFVKSKKDLGAGLRGYRKLARLAASATAPGGLLFIASCSHNVGVPEFAETVARGLVDAGRSGRILLSSGAAPDHPVHPALPESAYLKAQVLALD